MFTEGNPGASSRALKESEGAGLNHSGVLGAWAKAILVNDCREGTVFNNSGP